MVISQSYLNIYLENTIETFRGSEVKISTNLNSNQLIQLLLVDLKENLRTT